MKLDLTNPDSPWWSTYPILQLATFGGIDFAIHVAEVQSVYVHCSSEIVATDIHGNMFRSDYVALGAQDVQQACQMVEDAMLRFREESDPATVKQSVVEEVCEIFRKQVKELDGAKQELEQRLADLIAASIPAFSRMYERYESDFQAEEVPEIVSARETLAKFK